MPRRNRAAATRRRIGRVSLYLHDGAWWLCYHDSGRAVRRKLSDDLTAAEQAAAQVNAQLTQGAQMFVGFAHIDVPELVRRFLDRHQNVLGFFARTLTPVAQLFNLPAEAILPIVLASVRKEGIFLFVGGEGLAFPMSPAQALTGVYLAGVLLPCLVTTWTIARETSWRDTRRLVTRQALYAAAFSMILAWGGPWLL